MTASVASRARSACSRGLTPNASVMYGVEPRPMPNSARPRLSRSSVATRSAIA